MFRKIIQFGSNLTEGVMVFTPFEEEEDMQDMVEPNILPMNHIDGVFRARGFDQSRKLQKVISKRFVLYDKNLSDLVERTGSSICNNAICTASKSTYMSDFIDWVYRGLRGGVKRLYMVTEDGSVRWTWAEAVSVPYTHSFGDAKTWQPFAIEFMIHDPYWYEIGDDATFLYDSDTIPLASLVCACTSNTLDPTSHITKDYRHCAECDYVGVIIRDESLTGYIDPTLIDCVADGCVADPFVYDLGTFYYPFVSGSSITVCVKGSAGATRPYVGFHGAWTTPTLTNTENSNVLMYNGSMSTGDILEIDLNSSLSGDVQDLTINTNIVGFDLDDLTISSDIFELIAGNNDLTVSGAGDANSLFTFNYSNRYHN